MSYDIDIVATDPVERSREDFSPTYNYGPVFRRFWPEGIKAFDGMSCGEAVSQLRAAVRVLRATSEEDNLKVEAAFLDEGEANFRKDMHRRGYGERGGNLYDRERNRSWAPSDRNAAEALELIVAGCERWPHGRMVTR